LLAMGLFEMDGGCSANPGYDLGSVLFDKIILHLDKNYYGGKTFVIETRNNSEKNVFVQSARLNGQPLNIARLSHAAVVNGGKLVLQMGGQPNEEWGK
jgi:putative alpha-1,2-mannosidase